ncbi:MAG TPA: DUF3857 domain-containing protein [Steroidobacteraceae bacterium]|nr:DUF3857 domain-containing protein [Steroidobacteraceae bacterium]
MLMLCRSLVTALLLAVAMFAAALPARAADWLPISPEELKVTSEPKAPAAAAIYLYRQVDRDDNGPSEASYERIKILTEEGRQYANIEIPYYGGPESVRAVEARTIHPDGSIVKFEGTIFDKSVAAKAGVKLMAKTFTLPDVQVGSIIEYRYRLELRSGYVFDSHWMLSQDLFTQHAKFSLNPYRGFTLRYSWPQGLPPDTETPSQQRNGMIRLETRDVPAFVTEEYMPPENQLKYRVDFIYEDGVLHAEKDPEVFWQKFAKGKFGEIDKFLDQHRAMTEALAQIVEPGDSQDSKLHKIYERTQRLRNLTFERAKSQQESEREKLRDVKDVADVWIRGYGNGDQISWLFLALLRAAGIEAYPVLVSTRDTHFFNANLMNPSDLNTNVVLVVQGGEELYLDPGTRFAPFGSLPWAETAVIGLRLEKKGGTWIHTPLPGPAESRVERKATFQLTSSGALEGKVTVTYSGAEALERRLNERSADETERKQYLEDQLKTDVASGVLVELTNQPDWESSSPLLVAEYELKVPGWAARAGQRALLPVGIFGARSKRTFRHATRIHPLYFRFPFQETDDVAIELAPDWRMSSMPKSRKEDLDSFKYEISGEEKNGSLHLHREFTQHATVVAVKYYPSVLGFFEAARAGDGDQAVLTSARSGVAH